MRIATWIAAAGLAALPCVAPGCGAGEAAARPAARSTTPNHTEAPPPPASHSGPKPTREPMVALATALPEGRVEVLAIVMKERSPGLAGRPFESGRLVAIPADRFRAFQEGAAPAWKARVLKGRDYPLPDELLRDPTVYSAGLLPDGTCTLIMPPGLYNLCLANVGLEGDSKPGDPIRVQGCLEAVVSGEEFQTFVLALDRATGRITRID